jgi:hypothetical protein
MEQRTALTGFDRAGLKDRPKRVFHGKARIAGCGQGFPDDNGAVLSYQKQIGKSAADIDANAVHGSQFKVQGSRFQVQCLPDAEL